MTIPLHGKRSYVRIRRAELVDGIADASGNVPLVDDTWAVVSYATGFGFDLEQQNISRAIVMGTDGILDIESHGLLAIGNVDMILNTNQESIISAFGTTDLTGTKDGAADVTLDYDSKIANALAGTGFDGAVKVDLQIMPLSNYEKFLSTSGILRDDEQYGYVFTIENATLRFLRIRGSAGNYVTSALQVEGGRLRISQKKKS